MRKGVPQIGLSFFVNGFFFCPGASEGRPYHIRSIPSFLTHFIFSRFLRRVFQKFFLRRLEAGSAAAVYSQINMKMICVMYSRPHSGLTLYDKYDRNEKVVFSSNNSQDTPASVSGGRNAVLYAA